MFLGMSCNGNPNTTSWQFVTILRLGELVANSHEFLWYHFNGFVRSDYTQLMVRFRRESSCFFFSYFSLKIVCFHTNTHCTKSPHRKIDTFSHEIELTIPSHGYIHNIALPWVFASYKTTKNKTKMKNKQILRTYFLTKHYVIKVICGIRDEPILQFRLIRLNQ